MFLLMIVYCLVVAMQTDAAVAEKPIDFDIYWGISSSRTSGKQQYVASWEKDEDLFCALYDGHAGTESAQIAAHGLKTDKGSVAPLHELIIQSQDECPLSYEKAYKIIDDAICEDESHESGTSAVTCYLKKSGILTYSSIGNSRILFIKNSELFCTFPHTIENQLELERVRQSDGGSYFFEMGQNMPSSSRIVTRSLGDKKMKDNVKGMTAEPYVSRTSILHNGHLNYEGLILATRSLWDVMSVKEAATVFEKALYKKSDFFDEGIDNQEQKGNSYTVTYATKRLIDYARSKGSASDVTVIAITFALKPPVIHAIDINEDDLMESALPQPKENAVERSFNPCFVSDLQRRLFALQNQY
jgi:serine/threonine protein phosphatase PrpC